MDETRAPINAARRFPSATRPPIDLGSDRRLPRQSPRIRSLVLWLAVPFLLSGTAVAGPPDEARGLAQRLVPALAGQLAFETIPAAEGNDVFEIESLAGKVVLRGNSGVAMASALNRYLEEFGHCEISWNCGNQLALPAAAPPVPGKIRVVSPHRFRYAYNYCTHGYTMAWWDWPQWERELDFLALKGVNLALIIQGEEQVWIEALKEFGYTDESVRRWLCLPSHLPWQLMSNIEDYGGPLPSSLVERRLALGRKILARMRALGIEPVLQGFYGIVPSDFRTRFPAARVPAQGEWAAMKRPDMLDPRDPLFSRLAAAFYAAQSRVLGQANFFAGDPFHEGGKLDGIDLAACGQSIQRAMTASSPTAVWVLQSWLENPRQPMVDALDKSRLLVLDLHCEAEENWRARAQFGGTPWLWCMILNWGGNVGLTGNEEVVRERPARAFAEAGPGRGQMRGIGALMEGSQTQPWMWELFFGQAWRSNAPDADRWLRDYARRRYGADDPAALRALQIERATFYSPSEGVDSVVCARPSLDPYPKARFWGSTEPKYDTTRVVEAWRSMLEAAPACHASDGFAYDLTDLGRQVLADLAGRYHRAIAQAYARKDADAVRKLSGRMLGLLRDLDDLLATRREFLLGVWLADARRCGATRDEQDLCERGARELVTTWNNADAITDYGNRQWSGLVGTFYRARWQTWLDAIQTALAEGKPVDVDAVRTRIREDDLAWTRRHDPYPSEPYGGTLEISRRLFESYSLDASDRKLGMQ